MPRSISHNQILTYLETLQREHVSLNWFYRYNWMEIQGALQYQGDGFVMLLESHSGDLSKNEASANTRTRRTISILILKSCRLDDFTGQNKILDESEQICLDLVSRLNHDRKRLKKGDDLWWLHGFDAGSARYDVNPQAPLFGSYYGYNLLIDLNNPAEIEYSEEVRDRFSDC